MTDFEDKSQEALSKINKNRERTGTDGWVLKFCRDRDSEWWEAECDTQKIQRGSLDEVIALVGMLDGEFPIRV